MIEGNSIELVHPLYLDVPMMTSFLAAIEDGIAYGSNIRSQRGNQKASLAGAEARAGVPLLSSLLNLNLQGKIERNTSTEDSEEIELVRKHTEASLFIQLRETLHQSGTITLIDSQETPDAISHGSLVEITGQIFRSPASSSLDTIFQFLSFFGIEPQEEDQTPAKPQKAGSGQKQQPKGDPFEQIQKQFGPDGRPSNEFILKLLNRLRNDLTKARILDVVMKPANTPDLSVLIGLSSEFLPEGTFENILSGQFTVLGKVTRILNTGESISLYQRTASANLMMNPEINLREVLKPMQQHFGMSESATTDTIEAPALQLIPLAIFV